MVKMRCASIDRNAESSADDTYTRSSSKHRDTESAKKFVACSEIFLAAHDSHTIRAARHFKCNDADFIKIETFQTLTAQA